ncbi:MAG: helix-turn-helix domain-containing protein [Acidimicrobiia bacterium]
MTNRIRHVEFDPTAPVDSWPAEAIEALLDRGGVDDWHVLATEIRRSPWGRVARIVEQIIGWEEHGSVDVLMRTILGAARAAVAERGRKAYAAHVRALRKGTGMSLKDFAALAGTSAARLSAYERGLTAPTTDVLGRLEHAARIRAGRSSPERP